MVTAKLRGWALQVHPRKTDHADRWADSLASNDTICTETPVGLGLVGTLSVHFEVGIASSFLVFQHVPEIQLTQFLIDSLLL